MRWQHEVNKLFTDSFFRFLFGFTVIIASSFGVIIVANALGGSAPASASQTAESGIIHSQ